MITLAEYAVATAQTELSQVDGRLCACSRHSPGCPNTNNKDPRPTLKTLDDRPYLWLKEGVGQRAPLSRGGDAVLDRDLDLGTLSFVANAFNLPEAKRGINWLDIDMLLPFSDVEEGTVTHDGRVLYVTHFGYAQAVHQRYANNSRFIAQSRIHIRTAASRLCLRRSQRDVATQSKASL
ncbi:MAG: hypothetical protein EOQ80_17675 [Mesorhizobium sp.]|uniref:hypothetical protein n=1 Tax=Mesorhizobium sp. TaxID=1871066 RepID=UPI000FE56A3A|nr:hypothetical protein [Mesorhizobium sp.]RWH46233.1 MAG: hypothetical protein EOQ80_17675 [Mesorhizobium sp.]